ncbi:MAG: MlaD family protein [Thermodesulfobacteriota bacterium]
MIRRFFFIGACLILAGCLESDLPIQVVFDQTEGLEKGGRVLLNKAEIGTVTGISQNQETQSIASLLIYKGAAPKITENTRFTLTQDPEIAGKTAVEVFQPKTGGKPLPKNSMVKGSTRMSARVYRMQQDMDSVVESFKKTFDQLSKDLRGIPESQAAKKLEKELEELFKIMKDSGNTAREKFRKEVLPKLKEELDDLKYRLDRLGREKEYKTLELQFEEISRL